MADGASQSRVGIDSIPTRDWLALSAVGWGSRTESCLIGLRESVPAPRILCFGRLVLGTLVIGVYIYCYHV